jgi:hypothetical protein
VIAKLLRRFVLRRRASWGRTVLTRSAAAFCALGRISGDLCGMACALAVFEESRQAHATCFLARPVRTDLPPLKVGVLWHATLDHARSRVITHIDPTTCPLNARKFLSDACSHFSK